MSEIIEGINRDLPTEYPRLLKLEPIDGDYLAYMDNKSVLYLSINNDDYYKHLVIPLDAILLPKIIHLLNHGVVY